MRAYKQRRLPTTPLHSSDFSPNCSSYTVPGHSIAHASLFYTRFTKTSRCTLLRCSIKAILASRQHSQMWFAIFSAWSGQPLFERWSLAMYNIIFTAMPPLAMALFDRPATADVMLAKPSIYRLSQVIVSYWRPDNTNSYRTRPRLR